MCSTVFTLIFAFFQSFHISICLNGGSSGACPSIKKWKTVLLISLFFHWAPKNNVFFELEETLILGFVQICGLDEKLPIFFPDNWYTKYYYIKVILQKQ